MTHSLPSLAMDLHDSTLQDLAGQLESRVGPHTRMRYPDVHVYPRTPDEVFSKDDALQAYKLAADILQYVKTTFFGEM